MYWYSTTCTALVLLFHAPVCLGRAHGCGETTFLSSGIYELTISILFWQQVAHVYVRDAKAHMRESKKGHVTRYGIYE